ncbi:MAG: MFS transporter [Planctomycetes bacterium]|nr:MFS transporter [Planctomycetota bacterium]
MADAAPGKLSPEQKRGVFVVWLIIFIDLMGFGIVLPSLPYFVRIFEVPDWANAFARAIGLDRSRGGVLVGMILTAYSLCQFIFAPIWGRLSDKVGRRPILALSTSGFAATWVMFAFAPGFTFLLLSRALAGVCAANISTAQAYMADVFPPERRAKGMGLIGMAFGLGFVFGPAIGGALVSQTLLGWFGYVPTLDAQGVIVAGTEATNAFHRAQLMVPSLFAAGLSATSFILTLTIMRESLSKELRAGLGPRKSRMAQFAQALTRPAIGPMLIVYLIVTLGFAQLEAMFTQFNADFLKLSASANAWVFVVIGLTLAFVQGGLIGRLAKRFGSAKVLMVGLAGLTLAMFLFGFQQELNPGVNAYLWLILCAMLIGGTNALVNPNVLAIISSHARADEQGGTMGFTASAATLGRIIGPILGGYIYDRFGPEQPFAIGGVLIGLGLLLFLARWKVITRPAEHQVAA